MKEHDFMTDFEKEYWNAWRRAIEQFAALTLRAMGVDPEKHDIAFICHELFRSALEYEHETAGTPPTDPEVESRLHAARAVEHVRRIIAFNFGAAAQVYGILPIHSDGSSINEGHGDDC